jgi:hypothetical protein
MNKIFLNTLVLAFSVNLFAQEIQSNIQADPGAKQGAISEAFKNGEQELDQAFSNDKILKKIEALEKISCNKSTGLCTIYGNTNHSSGWTLTLSAGKGTNNSNSGTVIYTSGQATNSSNAPYSGVSLNYENKFCRSEIQINEAVNFTINRYMLGLMDEYGGTKTSFSPAEETMIMLYTTLVKSASACSTK